MKVIKGFITRAGAISNQPGVLSEFFELSPLAQTYSRERGEYWKSTQADYRLVTFSAVDAANNNLPYELPQSQVDEAIDVIHAVWQYGIDNLPPYDTADLVATVAVAFSANISQLAIGAIHSDGEISLPEWVSWTSLAHADVSIKVWLRNDSFENQYSDYEIVVVPPIDNLDLFFTNYATMVLSLASVTAPVIMERIQTAKGSQPDTYSHIYSFGFHNQNDVSQSYPTLWGAVVYGRNGDNIDAIKDAMMDYVLSNSSHNQNEWQVIFPDIFKRTEFLIFPRWDKISIPNLTSLAALYSCYADPLESIQFAKDQWTNISPAWIEENLNIVPFDYKAISTIVLNGQNNDQAVRYFNEVYPDYIPVNTTSVDFNRMAQATCDWVILINTLLAVAEVTDENASVLNPIRRVKRDGILYVTRVYNNVNYLVACRSNLDLPQ